MLPALASFSLPVISGLDGNGNQAPLRTVRGRNVSAPASINSQTKDVWGVCESLGSALMSHRSQKLVEAAAGGERSKQGACALG